jgi:hypothetical protein
MSSTNRLDPNELSLEQRGTLSSIQESISATRLRLLSAAAAARDQVKTSEETRLTFTQFQDEIVQQRAALGAVIDTNHLCLEKSVEENAAVLRGFDESEVMLRRILREIRVTETRHTVPQPSFSSLSPRESQIEVNQALPPRQPGESYEEFARRTFAYANLSF